MQRLEFLNPLWRKCVSPPLADDLQADVSDHIRLERNVTLRLMRCLDTLYLQAQAISEKAESKVACTIKITMRPRISHLDPPVPLEYL